MVHPFLKRRRGAERVEIPSPGAAFGPPDELTGDGATLQAQLGGGLGQCGARAVPLPAAALAAGARPAVGHDDDVTQFGCHAVTAAVEAAVKDESGADSGADGVSQFWRLEVLFVWRPARPWHGGGALLHPTENRHHPLAAARQRRGIRHAHHEIGQLAAGGDREVRRRVAFPLRVGPAFDGGLFLCTMPSDSRLACGSRHSAP